MKLAISQVRKNLNGRRHWDDVLKKFAIWTYGLLNDEDTMKLYKAISWYVFPSKQTVNREMAKYKMSDVEDDINFFK
jgi:hypothetical protein